MQPPSLTRYAWLSIAAAIATMAAEERRLLAHGIGGIALGRARVPGQPRRCADGARHVDRGRAARRTRTTRTGTARLSISRPARGRADRDRGDQHRGRRGGPPDASAGARAGGPRPRRVGRGGPAQPVRGTRADAGCEDASLGDAAGEFTSPADGRVDDRRCPRRRRGGGRHGLAPARSAGRDRRGGQHRLGRRAHPARLGGGTDGHGPAGKRAARAARTPATAMSARVSSTTRC